MCLNESLPGFTIRKFHFLVSGPYGGRIGRGGRGLPAVHIQLCEIFLKQVSQEHLDNSLIL